MSMYFERSVKDDYPGAGVMIPGDLTAEDCPGVGHFQQLVWLIGGGSPPKHPTTIVGGLAYTEATMEQLEAVCVLPPKMMVMVVPGEGVAEVRPKKRRRRKGKS